jgi:hypothetical protein
MNARSPEHRHLRAPGILQFPATRF